MNPPDYFQDYPQFVASRCKPGADILVSPRRAHLWHMSSKLCSESGELMDAIAKHIIYERPLDEANVKEEIGDALFYLQGLCNELGWTLEECIKENIEKLTRRYPQGYTNKDAQARADKQPPTHH